MLVAPRRESDKFETDLLKNEVRKTGQIGYGEECGLEVDVLKRRVRIDPTREDVELEANLRHLPELLKMCTVDKCKPAATPRL